VDMYVENTTRYPNWPINGVFADEKDSDDSGTHHMENKIRGAFGYINVDGPNTYLRPQKPNVDAHEVTLVFKFVKRDTGEPVNIPWMQFSFFDFDENDNNEPGDGMECLSASGFAEYALSEDSSVTETETVSNAGGINTGKFCSSEGGKGSDNPDDPLVLTTRQKEKTVSFFYEGNSEFTITYSVACCMPKGRNFAFAGKAKQIEDCPYPPTPPSPTPPSARPCCPRRPCRPGPRRRPWAALTRWSSARCGVSWRMA